MKTPILAGAALLAVAIALAPAQATETVTYTYDELGRLIASSSTGTVNSQSGTFRAGVRAGPSGTKGSLARYQF
jgi:hypothetical protein